MDKRNGAKDSGRLTLTGTRGEYVKLWVDLGYTLYQQFKKQPEATISLLTGSSKSKSLRKCWGGIYTVLAGHGIIKQVKDLPPDELNSLRNVVRGYVKGKGMSDEDKTYLAWAILTFKFYETYEPSKTESVNRD